MNTDENTVMELSEGAFVGRAREILALIQDLRGELGLPEALRVVVDRYVHEEAHPELKRFGEVVVLARRQALLQQQLDEDREQLHHGHLDHEGRVSTGHHYE